MKNYADLKPVRTPANTMYVKGKTPQEWAELHGVSVYHMYRQYKLYGVMDKLLDTATGGTIKKYRGLTLKSWADKLDVSYMTIKKHLDDYGHLDYVNTKKRNNKRQFHCPLGVYNSIRELSKATGLTYATCYNRIHNRSVVPYEDWYEMTD